MGGRSVVVDGDAHGMTLGVDGFLLPLEAALLEGEEVLMDDSDIRAQVEDGVRHESSAGRIRDDGTQERTLRGR